MLVVTALFSAGLEALAAYLGNHMANRLISELARRIFRHVLNLPLRYLQKWQVGETLARISEIDTVRGFLTGTVSGIALDVVFAITYIAALLSISPFLTSIVLIVLPLQIAAFAVVGPAVRRRMQESFLAGSRHQSRLVEAFGNAITVKALACEDVQVERFQETLSWSLLTGFRVAKLHSDLKILRLDEVLAHAISGFMPIAVRSMISRKANDELILVTCGIADSHSL